MPHRGREHGARAQRASLTTFAELLRGFRVARALTQEQLAERAQVTAKAVGALERGERSRPYPHTVQALAGALELDDEERLRFEAAVPSRVVLRAAAPAAQRSRVATGPVAASPALPAPAAPVIGRDAEVAALSELLVAGSRQLVTLTGPGGVGKTTLALVAAAAVRGQFPGGVVMVQLAEVIGADGVLPAIANAIGVSDVGFDGTGSTLAPFLAERRMLLLLDNVEHVLCSAADIAALATASPDLVVLATSRAPLRVRPEQEVRVAPLEPEAALRLFRERAAAAGETLDGGARTAQAVAALCQRADGLPLALELSASAAARLSPATLLERQDALPGSGPRDLPARQRSMSATFTWSHNLLSAPARSLLARLSVCIGGFSLTVAEGVSADPDTVLVALAELIEHSLVIRLAGIDGTARFRLLEPVRQDALARLSSAERRDARSGLARAVLETARGLVDDLHGAGQALALRLLEAELGNLRVTFEELLDEGRADDAAELLWLVWLFLAIRGRAREGSTWSERLRQQPISDLGRARMLVASAGVTHVANPQHACLLSQEGLALARRAGEAALAAEAATIGVTTAFFAGDLPTARELLVHADRESARADDPWTRAHVIVAAGQIALLSGRVDDAERILLQAEADARRLGSPFEMASVLTARAVLAELGGRFEESAVLLVEAIELAVGIGNYWTLTYILSPLAGIAIRFGDLVAGARLLGASVSYAVEQTAAEDLSRSDLVKRDLDDLRRRLGEPAFHAEWRAGREAGPDDILEWARGVRRSHC